MPLVARLAGLLLLALPVLPAAAAPAPVCRVVPDVRGDAHYGVDTFVASVALVPGTPGDDLLSADVASDGKHLTVIWRMAQVRVPDPMAPMGRDYVLTFDVRDQGTWFVAARTDPTGTVFSYGDFVSQTSFHPAPRVLGYGKGRLDTARGWVVADVPARAVAKGLRVGTYLRNLQVGINRHVGQGVVPDPQVAGEPVPLSGTDLHFDLASGDHYVVGRRSCLRPGV